MTSSASLARTQQALAAVMALVVLVLAVMAGRSSRLFGSWDIEIHGWIGNGLFVLALANVALAVAAGPRRSTLIVAVAIAVLTFAQIGLGYVGREELDAAAWHVPNGVLLMAMTTYQYAELRLAATGTADPSPSRSPR